MTDTPRRAIHLLALVGLSLWLGASTASPLTLEALRQLPPTVARAQVLQRVAEQAPTRAAAGDDSDFMPPTLTAFSAPASVRAGDTLNLPYAATDDLSGVLGMTAYARNEAGAWLGVYTDMRFPKAKLRDTAGGAVHRLQAPGLYRFEWAWLMDAAGNFSYVGSEALAALGNSTVRVINPRGHDLTPPQLLSGKVLTPSVSLSAPQRGGTQPAYAGMVVQVADTGDPLVAGVDFVLATMCQDLWVDCFTLEAHVHSAGQARRSVLLGTHPSQTGASTGTYRLAMLQLNDQTQNYLYLTSTDFGGETNFSTYFPDGTTITLTP